MQEKEIKGRIVHKHDIEENWKKATGFTPKNGEIVIYDDQKQKIKIGDGINNVNDLDFIIPSAISELTNDSNFIEFVDFPLDTVVPQIESGKFYTGESNIPNSGESEITLCCMLTGNNSSNDTFISYQNTYDTTIYFEWQPDGNGHITKLNDIGPILPGHSALIHISYGLYGSINTTDYIIQDLSFDNIYTKEEVNELISTIPKFSTLIVSELPTENISDTTIYLVGGGDESQNMFSEYIWLDGAWEKLGSQTATIDLSEYAKVSDIPTSVTQLNNDAGYIVADDLKTPINECVSESVTFDSNNIYSHENFAAVYYHCFTASLIKLF